MDLSGSVSGLNKRKHVADDGSAKIRKQQDKFKAVINIVKTTMKETEKAHLLEIAYCEKKAERDLLGRMKKSDFNIDEEIRLVDEELKLADVEKQAVKVTTIDWDKFEVDSEVVVGFLKTGISDAHPLSFLVRLCYSFISKDWIVQIFHVYREANRLADGLANYAFSLPLGFHALATRPDVVASIVLADQNEVTSLIRVRL